MESQNFDMFKNFGINRNIFNLDMDIENTKDIYVIQKDPMKKNFSESAIYKIPSNFMQKNFTKAKDDMEIYEECDQEYSILDSSSANFNIKIGTSTGLSNLFNQTNKKNYFSSFENLQNLEEKKQKQKKTIFTNSDSTGDLNLLNFQEKKKETKSNLVTQPEKEIEKSQKISEEIPSKDLEMKNGILKDSQEYQMEQLDRIFKEMNESKEAKVIIKAYKSKLKTKFYKIYESNSEFYKEKNKFKIFHKCNFPGCSRTFASAGWLKSHFNEHLQEIKVNKFNVEFERSLNKLRYTQILN